MPLTRVAKQKRHASRRARERWGAALTFQDIEMLNEVCRMGLGRTIQRKGGRGSVKLFVTTLDWIRIPVVFSRRFDTIVTVIPPEAAEVQRYIAKAHANTGGD